MTRSSVCFVEYLGVRSWVFEIWPNLLRRRLGKAGGKCDCYVIDASKFAMLLARISGRVVGVHVEKLVYSLVEMRDDAGNQIRSRIQLRGIAEVLRAIDEDPDWTALLRSGQLEGRLPMFLSRHLAGPARGSLWRALLLVMVCAWKTGRFSGADGGCVLFLERRPWMSHIARYAREYRVNVSPVYPVSNARAALFRWVRPEILRKLRMVRHRGLIHSFRPPPRGEPSVDNPSLVPSGKPASQSPAAPVSEPPAPVVATDYYGQLNLDHPELHSDLFFWQQSALRGSDLLLNLRFPEAPLNQEGWVELSKHKISSVALHPGATPVLNVPVLETAHRVKIDKQYGFPSDRNGIESHWLRTRIANYHSLRSDWANLFARKNVKVYTTWYKVGSFHCAIADAIQSLGGVTAIYQRTYEPLTMPINTVSSDIVFAFSSANAAVERSNGSDIRYHVTTGYLGDHRFKLLQDHATTMREMLQRHGAKRIVSYFDQNTLDDARWFTGHEFTQVSYAFLLEKVLAEPWFGLLLKPHVPGSLHKHLGPVAALLARAEATGRCYVYQGQGITGSYPPAAAALASDIAIHGHLVAGTAGMESALAGVPVLLLDREGWSASPLYQLGVGKVVFNDWEGLWEACCQHWSTGEGVQGFGDWTPMLDALDPFRDGRAAERMGTYIQWLIEDFRAGLDRDTVMANAAERYCSSWGDDKITRIEPQALATVGGQR